MKKPIKIAITGAAGNIGYAMLFRLAAGGPFGHDQPIILQLIEIEPVMKALEGTVMELNDCAFPLLAGIEATSDHKKGFDGANWALLVGSVPRKAGMERSDLLGINGKIFINQGNAIQENAASDIRTLVVGNPCNTNCLIAMNNAPEIPKQRWFAMTRLDENRAKSQLAQKSGLHCNDIKNMIIWGNHSATQYPDFKNAKIKNKVVNEIINDQNWLETDFIKTVQQRGAEIIKTRGASSAASAASAAIDTIRSLINPSQDGDARSIAVCSDGSYGIDEGLISSMPITCDGENWQVEQGFEIDDFSRKKIDASVSELKEERDAVKDLI